MFNGYEHQDLKTVQSDSLNGKLQHILASISELAKTTNIVSINASISASKLHTQEGRVFEEIAKEMRKISQNSLQEIKGLNDILRGVKELSEVINLAGRQRMLAQKVMKLACLIKIDGSESSSHTEHDSAHSLMQEITETVALFENSQQILINNHLNTREIDSALALISASWKNFQLALTAGNLRYANQLNNELVSHINTAVLRYQALGG